MVARNKKPRWLFPTSTNNLRMILAQGLLTSPRGFSKYYQDILEDYDGYLPLFNHQIPADSLAKATCEADHLIPCVLEFDLTGISGQITATKKGEIIKIQLESVSTEITGIEKLLIPLPIPLGCISKVIFKNQVQVEDFKKDADIRSNVIVNKLKLQSTKADSKLFEATSAEPSLELNHTETDKPYLPVTKPDYPATYAYGGMLSLLFYHAKNGELSSRFFDDFSQKKIPEINDSKTQLIPQLINEYFHGDIDESKPGNKMLKGIVAACITQNDFKNTVIDFLRNSNWDEESERRSRELADKLHDYASNSSRPVSDWFDSAKSDIEKVLLMLFTREDSKSLIDYHNPNISFSEREYVFFSLFFGIRDSFIKVPTFLRQYNGLQSYLSYKMADYAHQKMGALITFKEIKPPLTIWQFVDKKLSKSTVRLLGLQSCVQTIMSKADFQHVKGKSIYAGYLEPVYEVVSDNYFKKISTEVVTDIDYNKLK